jgi:site-specific recombinase XerD
LYLNTLEMPWDKSCFPRMRVANKLPVVLSPEEMAQYFEHVPSLKYRAALMLCYGAGLRISEAVSVKVRDVDSKRMLLRVEQGKGKKDRYAMLSPRLLAVLRCYYTHRVAIGNARLRSIDNRQVTFQANAGMADRTAISGIVCGGSGNRDSLGNGGQQGGGVGRQQLTA